MLFQRQIYLIVAYYIINLVRISQFEARIVALPHNFSKSFVKYISYKLNWYKSKKLLNL